MEDHMKEAKQLAYDINKLCLNLHSHLVHLPDEVTTSVNKVYLSSLLHPLLNLFTKSDYDEAVINAFNNEYMKRFPYLKVHNNVLWDVFRTFKRFKDCPKDSQNSEMTCKICNESVSSSEFSLFNHMANCKLNKSHDVFLERAVTDFNPEKKNYTYGYYCEYCTTYFRQTNNSFCSYGYAKTLHSKVCKGLKGDRTEVTWVHCDICRIDLCGDNVLELHKETIGHKIIELNFCNNLIGEQEDDCINLATAEYNFMMKYVSDIIEAVPSSIGASVNDVAGASGMSDLQDDKKCNGEYDEAKMNTYSDFMLAVVKKTIESKMNSNYNGYFCDFCQKWSFSEDKFGVHVNSLEHLDNLSQTCVQINSCTVCKLFIVGNDKTFDTHLKTEEHLALKYLFETDNKENNNDLNASVIDVKSDDENNNAEPYESDSSECETDYKKPDNIVQSNPGMSDSNLWKCMSISKESINSVQSTSSDYNLNHQRRRPRKSHGKMNIPGKESEKHVFRKASIVVSGFPLTTTRKDVFNTFRSYGHIDDIKFEKDSCRAVIIFAKKLVVDLLSESKKPIYINGEKVTIVKQTVSVNQPPPNQGDRKIPDILKNNYKSLEMFKALVSSVLIESISEETFLENSDGKMLLKNDFERAFKKEVKIIGSFGNGLALSTSSFDLYVDLDDNYFGKKIHDTLALAEIVGEIKYILKNYNKDKFTDISISNKGSLVLSVNDKQKHLCNIFFMNGLPDQNSNLIKTYVGMDLRVKDVILVVKNWMITANIMNSSNLSGYAVTWMVLYYLMADPKNSILPPVIILRSRPNDGQFVAGWDCRFTNDPSTLPKPTNKIPVEQLVYGFFKFYSADELLKVVLCPLTGEGIRKKRVMELDLPPPYRTYKFNLLKKTISESFPTSGGLCLQDPIQLNCNLTYMLQGPLLNNFKWMCREMMKLFKPWAENGA